MLAAIALGVVVGASSPARQPTLRRFDGMRSSSEYVTMRDGVRLAVDVHLPKGLRDGERTATILHMSRYYRSVQIRGIWKPFLGGLYPITERDLREDFVKAGYSWVDVDVRGSGASFGYVDYPLSDLEVRDGADLLDWIVDQPWSAGVVGAVGSSYDGILASLLARTGHPALKAIAPRFSAWDNFADEWAPGGLPAEGPMGEWFSLVNDLDRGDITDIFGWTAGVVTGGVRPVRAEILPKAMQEHQRNIDLDAVFARLQFRDDVAFGHSIDDTSPHSLGPAADEVPVYAYGGWFDAGLARGDARRFVAGANPGNRLRLGPWFHAGQFNASPFADHKDDFDHAKELLRFFDYHLRGVDEGFSREPRVAYYTMGPGDPGGVVGWRSADTWPVPGAETRTLFLSAGHRMSATAPAPESAADAYTVDLTAASDPGSRWGLIVGTGKKRGYGDQADLDEKLLVYTGAPLANAVEVTGHPIVHLFMDANAADGGVFAYLQDVRPDGDVRYVTEGELRLIDRRVVESPVAGDPVPYHSLRREDAEPMVPGEVAEVVFDLLPTSFVFPAGDSIRLAIAGADAGVFAIPDYPGDLIYQIHRDRQHPSRLELPTY